MYRVSLMFVLLWFSAYAYAQAGDFESGKRLVEQNCATCHAIGQTGESPFKEAPLFRDIYKSYDEGELEDAFNDGIVTSHPAMPDWKMTSDQAREIAAYIMSFADAP
jgi:cytochrome c